MDRLEAARERLDALERGVRELATARRVRLDTLGLAIADRKGRGRAFFVVDGEKSGLLVENTDGELRLALGLFRRTPTPTLFALDAGGAERLLLEVAGGDVLLALLDPEERVRLAMHLRGDTAAVTALDGNGRPRAGMAAPREGRACAVVKPKEVP